MPRESNPKRQTVPAIRVSQWLPQWDRFHYSAAERRRKPDDHFYLFSIDARMLRRLAGVNRRTKAGDGIDLGIQRRHEESRSAEIQRYVRNGYPFSILSEARREEPQNAVLRKPGWLPTALVVNILKTDDKRSGSQVAPEDLVTIKSSSNGVSSILLPAGSDRLNWSPSNLPPLEVIDGQHRLFAFDPKSTSVDFQLPVVAFVGLDISWQAYLFWTINIKPKKINASLAFDLYPLLRTEEWLEAADQFSVYRETRAQELVEELWSYPESAWHNRIDMLGERRGSVSQASFIRSLLATLIKREEGKGITIGGLFGGSLSGSGDPVPWSRVQQAAFLILFWQLLRDKVNASIDDWAMQLRESTDEDKLVDPAFFGRHTLLNQDQGVRVALHILNDLIVVSKSSLKLEEWSFEDKGSMKRPEVIDDAISSLRRRQLARFLGELAFELARFDWRSANASSLKQDQRREKLIYRGSGGYRVLRLDLLSHLANAKNLRISTAAKAVQRGMRKDAS